MKEIEDKIKEWEASKESWQETSCKESVLQAEWMIKGLRLALKIVNKKNNKKLQTDKKLCFYCKDLADGEPLSNFCSNCGMDFYR